MNHTLWNIILHLRTVRQADNRRHLVALLPVRCIHSSIQYMYSYIYIYL